MLDPAPIKRSCKHRSRNVPHSRTSACVPVSGSVFVDLLNGIKGETAAEKISQSRAFRELHLRSGP